MSFQAKYRDQCSGCGEPIHEGNWVHYEDEYLFHDTCPDPTTPGRNEHACHCGLIHPGECF